MYLRISDRRRQTAYKQQILLNYTQRVKGAWGSWGCGVWVRGQKMRREEWGGGYLWRGDEVQTFNYNQSPNIIKSSFIKKFNNFDKISWFILSPWITKSINDAFFFFWESDNKWVIFDPVKENKHAILALIKRLLFQKINLLFFFVNEISLRWFF